MAEKYKHFKEQTRLPLKLNIEKIWCGQTWTTIEQFLHSSVHTDMKSTKESNSQQKTPKSIHSWSNLFWNPIGNISVKGNTRKLQSKTLNTAEKNSYHQGKQLYPSIQWSKRESITSFLLLCLNNIWAPGHWDVCVSKCPTFFPVFAGQNQISGTLRATNEHVY